MFQQISKIGFASAIFFSLTISHSSAQNTTSQTGSLDATVSGENNQVYQTINQTIINHPGRGAIRRRNRTNYNKTPKNKPKASSHRHSEQREHFRKNNY